MYVATVTQTGNLSSHSSLVIIWSWQDQPVTSQPVLLYSRYVQKKERAGDVYVRVFYVSSPLRLSALSSLVVQDVLCFMFYVRTVPNSRRRQCVARIWREREREKGYWIFPRRPGSKNIRRIPIPNGLLLGAT